MSHLHNGGGQNRTKGIIEESIVFSKYDNFLKSKKT